MNYTVNLQNNSLNQIITQLNRKESWLAKSKSRIKEEYNSNFLGKIKT